jgi:DNA-binding GntR family transcriptional regulator
LAPLLHEHRGKHDVVIVLEAIERLRAVATEADEARPLNVCLKHPLLKIDRIALGVNRKAAE